MLRIGVLATQGRRPDDAYDPLPQGERESQLRFHHLAEIVWRCTLRAFSRDDWRVERLQYGVERRFVAELGIDQFAEKTSALVEFVEPASFDNAPVLEHQNAAGIADGREPVRDDESGSPFHHL